MIWYTCFLLLAPHFLWLDRTEKDSHSTPGTEGSLLSLSSPSNSSPGVPWALVLSLSSSRSLHRCYLDSRANRLKVQPSLPSSSASLLNMWPSHLPQIIKWCLPAASLPSQDRSSTEQGQWIREFPTRAKLGFSPTAGHKLSTRPAQHGFLKAADQWGFFSPAS